MFSQLQTLFQSFCPGLFLHPGAGSKVGCTEPVGAGAGSGKITQTRTKPNRGQFLVSIPQPTDF